MKSPIGRAVTKYPLIDRHDFVQGYVFGDEALDDLPDGQYHRGVHVFVETFGGGIVTQLIDNKIYPSAFGHPINHEVSIEAAKRIIEETFSVKVTATDIDPLSFLSPCEESQGELIKLYGYLMDVDKEAIKANVNVDKIIICQLDAILKDLFMRPNDYHPIFQILMNMFLTMYRTQGEV